MKQLGKLRWVIVFTIVLSGLVPAMAQDGSCVDVEVHPVAQAIATQFGLDYDTVIGWHCQGFGFGDIAIALRLAPQIGTDAASLLAEFAVVGEWGEILEAAGIHPRDFFGGGGGGVRIDEDEEEEEVEVEVADTGPPAWARGRGRP